MALYYIENSFALHHNYNYVKIGENFRVGKIISFNGIAMDFAASHFLLLKNTKTIIAPT